MQIFQCLFSCCGPTHTDCMQHFFLPKGIFRNVLDWRKHKEQQSINEVDSHQLITFHFLCSSLQHNSSKRGKYIYCKEEKIIQIKFLSLIYKTVPASETQVFYNFNYQFLCFPDQAVSTQLGFWLGACIIPFLACSHYSISVWQE